MNNQEGKQFISGEPSQEKILPALKALGFWRNQPTLLVMGSMQTATDEEQECILQLCAEGIGPMAEKHSLNLVVNGYDAQLLSLFTSVGEVCDFELLAVGPGIHDDGRSGLPHNALLLDSSATLLDEMKGSLVASKALTRQISTGKCSAAVLLVHGDDADWDRLCLCVQEGMPLIVVRGTGGIADKIGFAHNCSTNRGKTAGRLRYKRQPDLSRSDLLASGLLAHPWVTVASPEDPEQFSFNLNGQLGLLYS